MRARWWMAIGGPLVAAAMTGCASTGTMRGEFSGPGGAPARPVALNYQSDRSGDRGTLSLTLPDGEMFSGRYVAVGSAGIGPAAPGTDLNFSEINWDNTADQWSFDQPSDTDKLVALLEGNRGGRIRCRFTLVYPPGGLKDGGTGLCQVKGGERIDVKF
jgi:hypothetical protein